MTAAVGASAAVLCLRYTDFQIWDWGQEFLARLIKLKQEFVPTTGQL